MSEAGWRTWIRSNIRAADPVLWIVENKLACAPRPLRYHPKFGGRVPLIPPDAAPALSEWLASLKTLGIGTIVVLATPGEMKRYALVAAPQPDLFSLYQSVGFVVHSHPVEDPAHAAAAAKAGILAQLEALKPTVLQEFEERVGGMLIHCSGGMDRTSPIGAYVASRSGGAGPFR